MGDIQNQDEKLAKLEEGKVDEGAKPEEKPTASDESTAEADEKLGEAGIEALRKEREANKANARRIAELEKKLEETVNGSKTEEQKTLERLASLEKTLEAERHEKALLAAANKTGVPVAILAGPQDDFEAYAQALTEWQNSAKKAAVDDSGKPIPSISQRPESKGAVSLDEQIRAAEEAGDTGRVLALKAMKLSRK